MMKKRMIALLLAGLMTTATLASCRVQGNFDNPQGTEPNQGTSNQTTTTSQPDDPYIPPTVTWTDVDVTVYTVSDVKLRQDASDTSTALATIAKETALHCTKQSTTWYYVEYDGKQGYVRKTAVTGENILGTDMVEVAGGSKTMYVTTEGLQKRLYPSSNNNISTVLGSHKLNDAVIVTHTNQDWSRIQGENNTVYYLSNRYLSESKTDNPNDDSKYEHLFEALTTPITMYVDNVSQVKLRQAPTTSASELLALSKGSSVTVIKLGEVNGQKWANVVVEVQPSKPGDGSSYVYGYISYDCLSYNNGKMTVDGLINIYPMFEKIEATTVYIVIDAAITIRSTPEFPDEDEDNSLSNPKSTEASVKSLKLLAAGKVDETNWYIVEYTKQEGETTTVITGFIGGRALDYLTSNPNGKPTITLEDLLLKYPEQFTILETPITATTKSIANCYGTPATAKEPLEQLAADTSVTIVAKEKGEFKTWAVIQNSEGTYFFIQLSLLNAAE